MLQCHASGLQPSPARKKPFRARPFGKEASLRAMPWTGEKPRRQNDFRQSQRTGRNRQPGEAGCGPADSVCAQCHLTGASRNSARPYDGRFVPARSVAIDHFAYFVWTGAGSSTMGANSHFEKLQQSSCKRAERERLWCGSCHDRIASQNRRTRVDYYRSAARNVTRAPLARRTWPTRRNAQDDCIACTCQRPKSGIPSTPCLRIIRSAAPSA